jgi:hypothetical protein
MVYEETEIVAPLEMDVFAMIKSAADVPTVPCNTSVPPEVAVRKYPAVPLAPAVPDVMAFAVATAFVPVVATAPAKAVLFRVQVTRSVPVAPVSTLVGAVPVYILTVPLLSVAVMASSFVLAAAADHLVAVAMI